MGYVQVPSVSGGHGGAQSGVDRVILHGTVGPCSPGHSVGIAHYLNTRPGGALSVHYVVDPTTITQMLPESVVAYGDGHNVREVQIEFCDPQAGSAARWDDAAHTAMLVLAAPLVRAICQRHGVPMVRITEQLGTKRGICGHKDVSDTWHESTHQDPDTGGLFPWARFVAMVNGNSQEVPEVITDADIERLRAAVWGTPINYSGTKVPALQEVAQLRYKIAAYADTVTTAVATSADAIAAAVVAKLPAGTASDLPAIRAAVRAEVVSIITNGTAAAA